MSLEKVAAVAAKMKLSNPVWQRIDVGRNAFLR
jgi:hypothetical protein